MPSRGLTVDEVMAILPETPRRIAALTDGLTETELRASFQNQRAELLTVLEPLPPDGWDRVAMVTGSDGEIEPRTTLYYADWLADHEREHWTHLDDIAAAVRGR
jgi:hypothetical protein